MCVCACVNVYITFHLLRIERLKINQRDSLNRTDIKINKAVINDSMTKKQQITFKLPTSHKAYLLDHHL